MTDHSFFVIYPRYINANAKQVEGRRVNKELCPEDPTVKMMAEHLKKLYPNQEIVVEEKKRYPRSAVESHDIGRVKIKRGDVKKQDLLKALAQSILQQKPKRAAQPQQPPQQAQQPQGQQHGKNRRNR